MSQQVMISYQSIQYQVFGSEGYFKAKNDFMKVFSDGDYWVEIVNNLIDK